MNDDTNNIEVADWRKLPTNPMVSVYMLAFRHETFIAEAIEGVIAQRCDFPIELIIGEDCSPDRTREIALAYQSRYPQLIRVLISQQNIGAKANARNCQIACRGKYIAICEGDDYWIDSNKLAAQVAILESSPDVSLVCHAVNLFDEKDNQVKRHAHRVAHRSRSISPSELVIGDGSLIATCSIVVRADVMRDRPKWWEGCPIGDYPLVLRASQLGRVAYVDKVMGAYRINVPGAWSTRHAPDLALRIRHAEQIKEMLVGFARASSGKLNREVNIVISKYFFDALVRTRGTSTERRELFKQHRSTLRLADRWVAAIAVTSGQNLGWLRTPFKRLSRTLRRMRADATQSRSEGNDVAA